jgi:hypothetical protein
MKVDGARAAGAELARSLNRVTAKNSDAYGRDERRVGRELPAGANNKKCAGSDDEQKRAIMKIVSALSRRGLVSR